MTRPLAARQGAKSAVADTAAQVERMRRFNRFYTHKIGLLEGGKLYDPFSLAETRVLYEVAHRDRVTASDLVRDLGIDAGYLSRIVQNFDEAGLISRTPLPSDRRQYRLALTARGRQTFAKLERNMQEDVAAMLSRLPAGGAS